MGHEFAAARRPLWTAGTSITLGMPQLDGCGLSETWLQKTCGEIHWQGLAASLDRPAEEWTDTSGQRVYAAFGLVRLHSARLDAVHEGQRLRLRSRLGQIGRAQAWSSHRLSTAEGEIGELDMLSVFISRGNDGSNRSVRRVPMHHQDLPPTTACARALVDRARVWRSTIAAQAPREGTPRHSLRFTSCPRGDFNGARLVYFATFTAWADRALSTWGLLGAHSRVTQRECLYLGNLDVGHEVEVVWRGQTTVPAGQCMEIDIRCPRQDRLLARVQTIVAGVTGPVVTGSSVDGACGAYWHAPARGGLVAAGAEKSATDSEALSS